MQQYHSLVLLAGSLLGTGCSKPIAQINSQGERPSDRVGFVDDVSLTTSIDSTGFVAHGNGGFSYPSPVPLAGHAKGSAGKDKIDFHFVQYPDPAGPPQPPARANMGFYYLPYGSAYFWKRNPVVQTDRVVAAGYGTYLLVQADQSLDRVYFLEGDRVTVTLHHPADSSQSSMELTVPYTFVEIVPGGAPGTWRFAGTPQEINDVDSNETFVINYVTWAVTQQGAHYPPNWSGWQEGSYPPPSP